MFKLNPSTQQYVTLHSFDIYHAPKDGAWPSGGVILDSAGRLYGTTQEGGADGCWGGCGVVFEMDKDGNERVLLSFRPPAGYPVASLISDPAGVLYGTSSGGTYSAMGTVFAVSPVFATSHTLYAFSGGADGGLPYGTLVRDAQGNLYGTAFRGGDFNCIFSKGAGCGVVFEVNPAGKETVLHAFHGPPDGALPEAGLVRDKQGNLYGTTTWGGNLHYGTVFKLDKHGKMTVLHNFNGLDGSYPFGGLIQDAAGNLYGTTAYGGNFTNCPSWPGGCGTVFEITP